MTTCHTCGLFNARRWCSPAQRQIEVRAWLDAATTPDGALRPGASGCPGHQQRIGIPDGWRPVTIPPSLARDYPDGSVGTAHPDGAWRVALVGGGRRSGVVGGAGRTPHRTRQAAVAADEAWRRARE